MESNNNLEIIAAAKILSLISNVDGIIDKKEKNIICIILHDFFDISIDEASQLLIESERKIKKSDDVYSYSKILNQKFTYQDKIDFICCCFEVALADENLHYLENHFIKKIAFTLKIEDEDLINAKKEIKKYLS
jgi:uncharacterized tellurite resistance protein B-like protein